MKLPLRAALMFAVIVLAVCPARSETEGDDGLIFQNGSESQKVAKWNDLVEKALRSKLPEPVKETIAKAAKVKPKFGLMSACADCDDGAEATLETEIPGADLVRRFRDYIIVLHVSGAKEISERLTILMPNGEREDMSRASYKFDAADRLVEFTMDHGDIAVECRRGRRGVMKCAGDRRVLAVNSNAIGKSISEIAELLAR